MTPAMGLERVQAFLAHSLPLKNPVLVLAVTLLIILIAPLVFRRLKVPGIIGLIIAGMVIGPKTFHVIESTGSFELLSSTGLLYIMFLAGLEIDMQEFRHNRNQSLIFGALTFFLPISIGYFLCTVVFGFRTWPALLLASIFSTHTLLSYPIVSNLGIVKNRAVQATFGGTIITDSAVLILLGFITSVVTGVTDGVFWIRVVLSLSFLVFATLYVLPRISRWFFRHVQSQAGSHYIFVLAVVFISGFLSELAGVEPIIGAFLAGLGLNKVISHTGILMNRITFIGNTLFIPFFLISAGMLVDPHLFLQGSNALWFTAVLCAAGLLTKYLAARITGAIYRYSRSETGIMFGLSVSHAAATLAIIKVGFDLALFDQAVINAAILLILISCLVSSFVTEKAGRRIAVSVKEAVTHATGKTERILIPVSNPENIQRLIDLALLIKDPDSPEPLYPLSIIEDSADADEKINIIRKLAETVAEQIASGDKKVEVLKKVDINIVDGIVRAARAYNITDILISHRSQQIGANNLHGPKASGLLGKSRQAVVISKILRPTGTFERVVVLLSPNCELETGFSAVVKKIGALLKHAGSETLVYGAENSLQHFATQTGDRFKKFYRYKTTVGFENFPVLSHVKASDLFVFLCARKQTISYDFYVEDAARRLNRNEPLVSFVLFYPEIPRPLHKGNAGEIGDTVVGQGYEQVKQLTGKLTHIFRKDDDQKTQKRDHDSLDEED